MLRRMSVTTNSAEAAIELYYTIEGSGEHAFIRKHKLYDLLVEAEKPLNAAFGKETTKRLRLVKDWEGATTLFCMIMTSGDTQQACEALAKFDREWWLDRCGAVAGSLNFDIELV